MSSPIDVVLDATMLDTFLLCPAKFNYRFNLNKSAYEKPAPLDRGDLIHKGFEPYYLGLQAKKDFDECMNDAKVGIDLAATESDLEPDEISFLKKVMIENLTYWKARDVYFEILAVEKPFAYLLHEDEYVRITMIGKIDLLINEGSYTSVPMDHKTFSKEYNLKMSDGTMTSVLRKTNQFQNYAYAMSSNYIFVNRIGLQTSYPPEKKYKRVPLSYDPMFLQQWKQNVIKWVYFYVECASENSWPLNDTSCDKFFRLCEYYDICNTSGNEGKTYKLTANFKNTDKWDVAKSLGLGK